MGKLYEDLKEGFEDIIAYRRGKITLRSEKIEIPQPPKPYTAKGIKRIREKGDYSQGIFAAILNVSIKTVQSWESGERVPRACRQLSHMTEAARYTAARKFLAILS
jgi:putative transcriptional regulator